MYPVTRFQNQNNYFVTQQTYTGDDTYSQSSTEEIKPNQQKLK